MASEFLLIGVICCSSIYANLAFVVTDGADFRYLPPFEAFINTNENEHLGAEYFNIAKALAAGEGFSNPFVGEKTGATAWMPPLLPVVLAALIWTCNGDADVVMIVVIWLQMAVLIGTGLLVLGLIRKTTKRVSPVFAAAAFVAILFCDFHSWFQITHDSWLVLLALDLLIAGRFYWKNLLAYRTACFALVGSC